jgi:hypothetical protein
MAEQRIDPWDLDQLPAEQLEVAYHDLERFVEWLRAMGIAVPGCWYVHRWSVHRLMAVMGGAGRSPGVGVRRRRPPSGGRASGGSRGCATLGGARPLRPRAEALRERSGGAHAVVAEVIERHLLERSPGP